MDRSTFDGILRRVLTKHGVDPTGSGPVQFEKMTPIARDVRQELDRVGASDDDRHNCFDWLGSEVLDKSMTAAGRKMAIEHLAAGFGFKITLPS